MRFYLMYSKTGQGLGPKVDYMKLTLSTVVPWL